jgi:hypothetical protein
MTFLLRISFAFIYSVNLPSTEVFRPVIVLLISSNALSDLSKRELSPFKMASLCHRGREFTYIHPLLAKEAVRDKRRLQEILYKQDLRCFRKHLLWA